MWDKEVFRKAEKQHSSALWGLLPLPCGGRKNLFRTLPGRLFSRFGEENP